MSWFLNLLLTILGLLFLLRINGRRQQTKKTRQQLEQTHGCGPPSKYPHQDPIFGSDYLFRTVQQMKGNRFLPSMQDQFQSYGLTFQTIIFGSLVVNTAEPKNLQAAFTKSKDWGVEPDRIGSLEPFCGRGFISADGPSWERARALLLPTFKASNLQDFSAFETSLESFLNEIPRDGSTVDVQPLLYALFLDTAMYFVLGQSLRELSEQNRETTDVEAPPVDSMTFLRAFQTVLKGLEIRIVLGRLRVLLPQREWKSSCRITHRYLDYYINKAASLHNYRQKDQSPPKVEVKHQINSLSAVDDDIGAKQRPRSLLQGLMEQTDDKIEIRNQIIQAMMAAQDTTSVLLSNTIFLLSRHPSVWTRLRSDILSLDSTVPLTLSMLNSLSFLRKVLHESLRLYPVFAQNARVALRATTLPTGGGPGPHRTLPIYIAPGTRLFTHFYTLHRDSHVFGPSDVESFDPDRWDTIKPSPWEFMPFGGGDRVCVGQNKAMAEAGFVLVGIARRFKSLECRDGGRGWEGEIKLTARNANGCLVAFREG